MKRKTGLVKLFDRQKISIDSEKYDFRQYLKFLFDTGTIENIHKTHVHLLPSQEQMCRPWPHNENSLTFHEIFYNKLNEPWQEIIDLYEDFIDCYIPDLVGENFLYQSFPTFRVHLPNFQAVTKWHYDADEEHGHPYGEINFIIPLTNMFSTNAIWCESEHLKGDYAPMEASTEEMIMFNGNVLHHGNKVNLTNQTRFSFDFRVLPEKFTPATGLFPDKFGVSATRSKKWEDGGYYKKYGKK